MSQPRSVYRTDFNADAWFENNFAYSEEFCSSDNVDDCLKYISQELSALGYPSIYSNPSSCPYAVNCDIVRLLNTLFDLLKDFREQSYSKDSLEERNQLLLSDLNTLNQKNSQLKDRFDQSERKYNSALEKERQLKLKNDSLAQLLKNEKEEVKKLSSKIQHQKVNFQHEVRKYQSQLNQMKSRLTQIISDKNPEKKIASISTNHLLSRNTNQRGKWKTGSSAKSSSEEMYNSVISNYNDRCQAAEEEIGQYQLCLKDIENQIVDIISLGEEESFKESLPSLDAILYDTKNHEKLKERFSLTLSKLKELVEKKTAEDNASKVPVAELKFSNQDSSNHDSLDGKLSVKQVTSKNLNSDKEYSEKHLLKEKIAISEEREKIKKEKSKLEAQKLEMLNMLNNHSSSNPAFSSKSVPSFSVVTTNTGVVGVPPAHQLKQCLSLPRECAESLSPLWEMDVLNTDSKFSTPPSSLTDGGDAISPPDNLNDSQVLPKWARAALSSSTAQKRSSDSDTFSPLSTHEISIAESISNEDLETTELESSEEENLAKLKAAVEEMQRKRNNS